MTTAHHLTQGTRQSQLLIISARSKTHNQNYEKELKLTKVMKSLAIQTTLSIRIAPTEEKATKMSLNSIKNKRGKFLRKSREYLMESVRKVSMRTSSRPITQKYKSKNQLSMIIILINLRNQINSKRVLKSTCRCRISRSIKRKCKRRERCQRIVAIARKARRAKRVKRIRNRISKRV